jgi:hypothetical protein
MILLIVEGLNFAKRSQPGDVAAFEKGQRGTAAG